MWEVVVVAAAAAVMAAAAAAVAERRRAMAARQIGGQESRGARSWSTIITLRATWPTRASSQRYPGTLWWQSRQEMVGVLGWRHWVSR